MTLGRPEWLRGATARKRAMSWNSGLRRSGWPGWRSAWAPTPVTYSANWDSRVWPTTSTSPSTRGSFFWDSADAYKTHPHIKQGLKGLPREKVTILTKTDVHTAEAMKADLDRYRQELGTDYIDIVLLHGMRSPNWTTEMKGVMDVLSEAKEKKIIRSHGASIHSLDAMKLAAKTPWCEIHLQGINHAGIRMDSTNVAEVVAVFQESKKNGKGVMGMKVLGEGRLRDQIDKTLGFVLGLDCLDCFTIGAANRNELSDLIKRVPAASVA